MPATVKTREQFNKSVKRAALEAEVKLRIKAGAISSKIIDEGSHWILETEWNVIGSNE